MLLTFLHYSTQNREHNAPTINTLQQITIYTAFMNQQQISLLNDGIALADVESLNRDIHN